MSSSPDGAFASPSATTPTGHAYREDERGNVLVNLASGGEAVIAPPGATIDGGASMSMRIPRGDGTSYRLDVLADGTERLTVFDAEWAELLQ